MRRRTQSLVKRLVQFGVVCALLPVVCSAQPFDLDTPVDSPLWWTLTDGISPQELREAYRDLESSRRRFREAVAAGLQPPATKDKGLQHLKFYVNSQITPELVPMWLVFETVANMWLPAEGREEVERSLASHGVASSGIERVLAVAADNAVQVQRNVNEIGPLQQEYIRMQWEILNRDNWSEKSKDAVEAAVGSDDLLFFSQGTGRSEAEVAKLIAAGKDNYLARVTEESLVTLKRELSPADWRGLRRYLFDRAASGFGGMMDSSG